MPSKRNRKTDQTNVEKMKNEMRRKKEKAERATAAGLNGNGGSADMPQGQDNGETEFIRPEGALFVQSVHARGKTVEDVRADDLKLVVFRVGDGTFAIRLKHVKEVIRFDGIRRVPNVPDYVAGLCNLRGSVLPVVDIRRCLHMPEKEYDDAGRILVTDIYGRNVGILIDGVSEVISVKASSILELPAQIKKYQNGGISGIVVESDGHRIIMVLDVEKMINLDWSNVNDTSQQGSEREESCFSTADRYDEVDLVIFCIRGELYALDVRNVEKIMRYGGLSKVPNSPYYVEGVISIRNRLLAVINLAKLFGDDPHGLNESARIILVDVGDFSYGMMVDKVLEVTRVSRKFLCKPSDIAQNAEMRFVRELVNLNNGKRVIMVLDPHKIIFFNH